MLSSCVADFTIIVAVYCIVFVCTFTASNAPSKCTSTGANCVISCANQPNGDYQSCNGCGVYVTCSNGITFDNRPCAPVGLAWNDKIKACDWTSPTCDCVGK